MSLRRAGQRVLGRVSISRFILNIRLISERMEVGRRLIKASMLVDLMKQSPVLRSTFRIFFRQSITQLRPEVMSDCQGFSRYLVQVRTKGLVTHRTKCQRGFISLTFKEGIGISLLVFIVRAKDRQDQICNLF